MVRTSSLLTLLATAATAVVGQDTDSDPNKAQPAIPGAFIIEFQDGHVRTAAIGIDNDLCREILTATAEQQGRS